MICLTKCNPYQLTKAVGEGNVAAHSIIAFLAEQAKN